MSPQSEEIRVRVSQTMVVLAAAVTIIITAAIYHKVTKAMDFASTPQSQARLPRS